MDAGVQSLEGRNGDASGVGDGVTRASVTCLQGVTAGDNAELVVVAV